MAIVGSLLGAVGLPEKTTFLSVTLSWINKKVNIIIMKSTETINERWYGISSSSQLEHTAVLPMVPLCTRNYADNTGLV